MSQGYDQFFKSARQASGKPKPKIAIPKASAKATPRFDIPTNKISEEAVRQMAGFRPKRRKPNRKFPWVMVFISVFGIAAAVWALLNSDQVEQYSKNIEITLSGEAQAAEAPAKPKQDATKTTAAADDKKADNEAQASQVSPDLDHLSKLTERSKELDAREAEIARQETELAKMKEDLEGRLKDLEAMRAKISDMLADRVKVDEQKVNTLVDTFSNMKPQQAAKVLGAMDEDLAVEIVSRMKKKSAADIMNLLSPEKAELFSEKYAGYKRK